MAQLQCKTLGGVSAQGKAQIYFACHPQDYTGCFQEITDELLRLCDCAVYYYGEEPELNEEYYENLERMKLIVMPVTTRLLYLPNRAMDVEFAYAMEHHIPVLPLMQERGLEDKYGEIFGNLQFLDKGNRDLTAIPYEEKLKKYLDAVLLNDEMIAQVRVAFDAWIFLSYRKKDRKAAQDLMKLIHSDPRCRDIAIWYDEFLNPGEDFNEAIRRALAESQLFVLAVTPNLLEMGNYVMKEEYPEAKKSGKPILPAEMEQTDWDALKQDFEDLPDPLDPGCSGVVSAAVLDALGTMAIRENDEDPKHNFFIGLAYLSGLFVEKDHERAVKLITQAAEAGLTEAMEKLVTMYETGEGVQRDYRMSIAWLEKLERSAKMQLHQDRTPDHAKEYARILHALGSTWLAVQEMQQAIDAFGQMIQLAESFLEECPGDDWVLALQAEGYNQFARIYIQFGDTLHPRKICDTCIDINEKRVQNGVESAQWELYENYRTKGAFFETDGKPKEAKIWYGKARNLLQNLIKEDTIRKMRALCVSTADRGRVCELGGMLHMATLVYKECIEMSERLAQTGDPYDVRCYATNLRHMGDVYWERNQSERGRPYYIQALDTYNKSNPPDTAESRFFVVSIIEKLGQISMAQGDLEDAERYFTQCLEEIDPFEQTRIWTYQGLMMQVYLNMGDLCALQGKRPQARAWYEKGHTCADAEAEKRFSVANLGEVFVFRTRIAALEHNFTELQKAYEMLRFVAAQRKNAVWYRKQLSWAEQKIQEMRTDA